MVGGLKLRVSILLAIFFQVTWAQSPRNDLPKFKGFKHWGYHLSGTLYRAGVVERQFGSYDLESQPVLTGRIGFEYIFNHQKEWIFRSGIYLDLAPFYNLRFGILERDLPENYGYTYFT
ncbi:hypothetical protein [Mesonia maritima]|uniref:Uncharacterized protein n=1 Tax=Mesonia maritima TaxID=1793873 RepID=A0ABU1K6R4_9FLAO|nr:hypothetical protein [Mesonia maritima]MDR6301293.1 hypothetical protein [Mesonia maritima]